MLPPVAPLPPDVWDKFMAALRRGPTPKQVEAVKRAMDITRNMARPGDEDYDEPETQRALERARRHKQDPVLNLRPVDPRALERARRGATRAGEGADEGRGVHP